MLLMATKMSCSFAGLLASCALLAGTFPVPGQTPGLPALPPLSPAAPQLPPQSAPPPQSTPQTLRVQPDIEVKQTIQPSTARGEVRFLVEVRNVGTIPVQELTLRTRLPSGVTLLGADPAPERLHSSVSWSLGAFNSGASGTLRLVILTGGGEAQALPFSLSFQVSNNLSVPVVTPRGEVAVDGPAAASVNVPLTLKVTVKNPGAAPLNQGLLRIILPPGLSHPAGSDLENQLPSLGPGQTLTIPITLTPTREGNACVKLRLMPSGGEAIEADHTVAVRQDPLSLSAGGPTFAKLRDVCTCSLDVGCNESTPGSARLVAHLPEGIAYLRSNEGATYDPATHSVVWNLTDIGPARPQRLALQVVARQIGVQQFRAVLIASQDRVKQAIWSIRVTLPSPPSPSQSER
jgi:hypothetical protein